MPSGPVQSLIADVRLGVNTSVSAAAVGSDGDSP
jgi:hypothetical protein